MNTLISLICLEWCWKHYAELLRSSQRSNTPDISESTAMKELVWFKSYLHFLMYSIHTSLRLMEKHGVSLWKPARHIQPKTRKLGVLYGNVNTLLSAPHLSAADERQGIKLLRYKCQNKDLEGAVALGQNKYPSHSLILKSCNFRKKLRVFQSVNDQSRGKSELLLCCHCLSPGCSSQLHFL